MFKLLMFSAFSIMAIAAGCDTAHDGTIQGDAGVTPDVSNEASNVVDLYRNATYGFAISTTPECLKVLSIEQDTNDNMVFNVMAPLDEQWPKTSPWFMYDVMTQSEYDAMPVYPGTPMAEKPPVVAILKGSNVLVVKPPQDCPISCCSCELTARAL